MPQATFLHLSDFHFRADTVWDSKGLFVGFENDLQQWQQAGRSIDAIVITGDIAFSGQKKDYQLALKKINKIIELTHVKMENVFVIPGNHDLNRSEISKPEEVTTRYILENCNNVDEFFRQYQDYELFLDKFKAYREFTNLLKTPNKWNDNGDPKNGLRPWYSVRRQIPDKENGIFFRIIGLTTALFIDKTIKAEEMYGKIRISARQIQECLNEAKNDEFILLLGHHPISWFCPDDNRLVKTLVGQKKAIYLHGHVHEHDLEHNVQFNRQFHSLCTGSVYSESTHPNKYHIFSLDFDTNKLIVWPRKWNMQWHQDNDLIDLNTDQSYRINLPWERNLVNPQNSIFTPSPGLNPYDLNGRQLSFIDFPDLLKMTADKQGKIKVKVVVGSGRFTEADHVSYGTDCLGIPEITAALEKPDENGKLPNIDISSCLDIDIFNTPMISEENLILLGSGKVNYVTLKLLEHFGGTTDFKFNHPEYSTITSSRSGITYVDGDQENWGLGILALFRNPWASDIKKARIIILMAGFHPLGSIAANKVLTDFVKYPYMRRDNIPKANTHFTDGSIPMKILRGHGVSFADYVNTNRDIIERPIKNKTYIGRLSKVDVLE
jgi:predicted MPP superfamily phosphohydrolase